VQPPTTLHWLPGVTAGCFYTAELLARRRAPVDPALADALADPAERLDEALREQHVPPATFWHHLVPLAACISSTHELAEVTLIKTVGRTQAEPRVDRFRGLLHDLTIAYTRALPGLDETLARAIEKVRPRWDNRGVGVLTGVANWTEPAVLVEEATVAVVHPAFGGGSSACLAYRTACLEAVPADPVPELPEVVRLAWLLAQLNLAVPRYAEGLRHNPPATVAGLALVSVTLAAAELPELARCDAPTIDTAVRTWLRPADADADAWTAVVAEWWGVYRVMKPAWATALQALDAMLAGQGEGDGAECGAGQAQRGCETECAGRPE
jgi:hypothetical protein